MYVLHGRESGLEPLLRLLKLPHGEKLPESGGVEAIIRWGTRAREPDHVWTLNRLKPVLRTANRQEREQTLRLHGLKTGPPSGQPFSHRLDSSRQSYEPHRHPQSNPTNSSPSGFPLYIYEYWIPVFHLEALTVYEKKAVEPLRVRTVASSRPAYRELEGGAWSYHVRRAVKDSLRAVYVLGLDYALVKAAVTADSRTVIVDVVPNPRLSEPLARLFAEAIHKFAAKVEQEAESKSEVLLGADPEFVLRNREGQMVPASRFMDREGPVGCDAVVLSGQRTIKPLVELRPEPSADPRLLVLQLRRCMRMAAGIITDPELVWTSGGMPVRGIPLGGHIHLSGVWLHSRFIRLLDNYLSLPMLLTEDDNSRRRRPRYGYLGDVRRKSHGGFEYRSLPSWLHSPRLAAGVLCLARCIADHYRDLKLEPLERADVQKAFYEGDKRYLQSIVREIWKDLERLPGYSVYGKELNALKQIVFGGNIPATGDFRLAWKLPVAPQKVLNQV
ncbi:hypothetical protein [Paenibacillus sp. J2TS4]|uniref:putative amidoligase domain-containing protein n=1 Tax=Paenibacillus sp. J2TS4 TaxID=2807194 RepID=UPI0020C0F65A|nr:hypothetical protein [Paenibacillus sp. J2TS4]